MRSRTCSMLLVLFATFVTGCSTRPTALDANSRDESGAVFVSVSSAAPIGDYVRSLGPDFELSAADALEIAVPVSQSSLFKAVDALRGSVAINRTIGTAPTTPTATIPTADADGTLPTLTLGGFPADRQIGIDPVLRYQAATRLLSEMKMLNRALRNAPFDTATEQAHLVQFNVTVMPHHDAAPYDAYVDLTVADSQGTVRLIPALLNDSTELTQQQWAKNSVRAFNVATTTAFGAIAAALGLNYSNNQLEEVAGYSLNGITNVGRVSDGALRIRLAAQNQGRKGERFLTARTHNIFVVVISKFNHAKPSTVNTIGLCARFEFRRVNGSTVPHTQKTCDTSGYLKISLPADDYATFSSLADKHLDPAKLTLNLAAFAPNEKKPSELKVVVPAWDAQYLGDLRAVVKDCNGTLQLGAMSADKFGKALSVSFLFPGSECDLVGSGNRPQPVTLIIERAHATKKSDLAVAATVKLPAWDRKVSDDQKKVAQESKVASCAVAGKFIRAANLVVDQTGKGTLQALINLDKGEKNKYTGKTPLIAEYLLVEGADAVSVLPADADGTSVLRSRIGFSKSTRYSIALQNAVPNKSIVIDFSKLKGDNFDDAKRCTVMPVLLTTPKPKHGT